MTRSNRGEQIDDKVYVVLTRAQAEFLENNCVMNLKHATQMETIQNVGLNRIGAFVTMHNQIKDILAAIRRAQED